MHEMKDKAATLKAMMALAKLKPASREAVIRNEAIRRGRDPSRQSLDDHLEASEIEPSERATSPPLAHPTPAIPPQHFDPQGSEIILKSKMKNLFRWLLVLPAALAAMFAAFFVLGWAWQISRTIGIVPQDGFIDVAFATLMINGAASSAGVYAGASTAPSRRHIVAIVLAVLVVLACIVNIVFGIGARSAYSAATGWMVWTNIGQIGGALITTFSILKEEKTMLLAQDTKPKTTPPGCSGLTAEEAEDVVNFRMLSRLKDVVPVRSTTDRN